MTKNISTENCKGSYAEIIFQSAERHSVLSVTWAGRCIQIWVCHWSGILGEIFSKWVILSLACFEGIKTLLIGLKNPVKVFAYSSCVVGSDKQWSVGSSVLLCGAEGSLQLVLSARNRPEIPPLSH